MLNRKGAGLQGPTEGSRQGQQEGMAGAHFGGVQEVEAGLIKGVVQLLMRLRLRVLTAPRHSSEATLCAAPASAAFKTRQPATLECPPPRGRGMYTLQLAFNPVMGCTVLRCLGYCDASCIESWPSAVWHETA